MKKISIFKENYYSIFLILYFVIGIIFSMNVGITHDEPHSNWVWELNKKKLSNLFLSTNYDINYLNTYHGYYGVGQYFISEPFEFLLSLFFSQDNINQEGRILLFKHPTVFFFYFVSGIFFRKLIFLSVKNKNFANLSTILFLTYPYILGHSFFNVKDVPFMSIWVLCTYYLIKNLNNFFNKNTFKIKDLLILSISTSFLLSIRVNGIIIFLEYLIFLIFYLNVFKINLLSFVIKIKKELFLFITTFLITTYLFHPNFWDDPKKFLDAIIFFSKHIQTVCTVTLGECMPTQDLPPSYIFIWLLFKLPILILFGLILFPLLEKKLFLSKNNILILGSLITTVLSIILIFIIFKVNLYDEIRQILFLMPLIFIISLTLLFNFKKKLSNYLVSIFIIFFVVQNIKIFPYNYLWLNNFNILINVNKNFELDYWGVSTKNIASFLNSESADEKICIISNRNIGIKYYISNQNKCFKPFNTLHQKNERPFYVALTERALRKGVPNGCSIINEEKMKLNFSKEEIVLAKIYKCI